MSFAFRPQRPRSVERTHAPSVATIQAITAYAPAGVLAVLPRRAPRAPWRRMIQLALPWRKP